MDSMFTAFLLPMLSVLSVTVPFFALIVMGYVAVKWQWLPLTAIPGLNAYVLFFALPSLLFRFGASTPITKLIDPSMALIYAVSGLAVVILTIALTLAPRINWENASFGALVAASSNSGFMGMPMLLALLGPAAAAPIIITLVIDMVLISSTGIVLSQFHGPEGSSMRAAFKRSIKSLASNPMPWSVLLGGAFSAMEWQLLAPVAKTVELLGVSASPVALFTIGAVLGRSSVLAARSPLNSAAAVVTVTLPPVPPAAALALDYAGDVWLIAAMKLFLHPLLVSVVGIAAYQLGAPVDPFALKVIVLVAALPSASNIALLSERFEANTHRIARTILISTLFAFVTFPCAVVLLE